MPPTVDCAASAFAGYGAEQGNQTDRIDDDEQGDEVMEDRARQA